MKKLSIIISIFILASILMTSCSKKQVVYPEVYDVKLVGLSAGGGGSSGEVEKDVLKSSSYEKNNMPRKDINNLFGVKANIKAYYWETRNNPTVNYEIDAYDSDRSFVKYNAKTNKIVKLDQYDKFEYDPNFVSEVNPSSSDEEYIEYAKKVLLENAGVSADGWEATVNIYEDNDCYVSFSKKIDGFDRNDGMSVIMSTRGEVRFYNAINSDEYFKPFENATIDKEKLEESIWEAFSDVEIAPTSIIFGFQRDKMTIRLAAIKNELWAHATVEYSYKTEYKEDILEFKGMVAYEIKLAEAK